MIELIEGQSFLKPPIDSVPHFMALARLLTMQLLIMIFSQGAVLVLFSTMPSPSESIMLFERIKRRQLSMSIPSLLPLL
ncbi:hypothetical protein [Bacteroides oleiciplenus]|uniref:hypothetical protein n=1 Tax=Bacteroides oleiciplenus TaxID=626931 RepID=UPI00216B5668|nr:hypothetical protein [Bacteroides oleiciplenus]